MLTPRSVRSLPSLPSAEELEAQTIARLDAMFLAPRRPRAGVWAALTSAALGCAVGVLATLLCAPPPTALASLTPQQQTLYSLVQDLAQADTPDQTWTVLARIERVVKTLHPQPRPEGEPLLPSAALVERGLP
jgi:hypothetical protein